MDYKLGRGNTGAALESAARVSAVPVTPSPAVHAQSHVALESASHTLTGCTCAVSLLTLSLALLTPFLSSPFSWITVAPHRGFNLDFFFS